MTYPPITPPQTPSNLGDMILKIRRITKSPSQNQITDSQVVQYINTYLIYDFPEILRLKDLLTNFTFSTVPSVGEYLFDTVNYTLAEQPIYINGYQSFFTQSQDQFYLLYPKLGIQFQPAFGTGSKSEFTFTLPFPNGTQTPPLPPLNQPPPLSGIFPRELVISAQDTNGNSMVVRDMPLPIPAPVQQTTYFGLDNPFYNAQINNALVGDIDTSQPFANNNVNYITFTITVTFAEPVKAGFPVTVQYVPYNASRPVACLFYNNIFHLRPIPDSSYLVKIQAYIKPNALGGINLTDSTTENIIQQWWQPVALGAALKIFEDRGDFDQYQKYFLIYDEYKRLAQRRTLMEQSSERTATIYTEQVQYPIGNYFGQF